MEKIIKTVNLKSYRAKELTFVNSVKNGTKIQFENKYSYNVNYAQNNMCMGVLSVSAICKDEPKKFYAKAEVEGIFEFNPDLPKEKIHIETFKALFPYARTYISTISSLSGVPPIIIPEIDIESQSIYKYDANSNLFGKPQENNGDDEDETD